MSEHDRPSLPEWAEQDRVADLARTEEIVLIFVPAAQQGCETYGRGAIVVDARLRPVNSRPSRVKRF